MDKTASQNVTREPTHQGIAELAAEATTGESDAA
jgi:hypothetical protein